ncbi:MAG: DUF5930 domain-containing protein [Paracoccus sp. (in: a-proteobacteria)]|nr:DUF5930 domain-containing protein [Paracoccus sp. (in: a-proteobacteria)]
MPRRIVNRVNAALESRLPEKRLFLKSETSTRYVRLRPMTQAAALAGTALIFGWSIIATSILVIDGISAGGSGDQAGRAQAAFEERLNALSAERDSRAAEAAAAQARFSVALDQVSKMQSQLLASEERRRELETGIGVVQGTLRTARSERAQSKTRADERVAGATADQAAATTARSEEVSVALDILSGELQDAAQTRATAVAEADKAKLALTEVETERDQIIARNDAILSQIEDAMVVSVEPMNKMFRNLGMNPDRVLATVRKGYSGKGGPLTPIAYSSSGNADITATDARAKKILVSLDQVNTYRIAADKLPLAMPVKSAFRYTSPFGRRWGRLHAGIDMAGPVGTPIFSTGDGVVTYAGWQSGYGKVIKIRHELGTQTVYGHLNRIGVKAGQKVSRGERIGDMGNTGRSTGPHLHYEVHVDGAPVNPMKFIKAAQDVF